MPMIVKVKSVSAFVMVTVSGMVSVPLAPFSLLPLVFLTLRTSAVFRSRSC